ncbi:hypothetical protein ACX0G9_02150 [Flavitalea flava]
MTRLSQSYVVRFVRLFLSTGALCLSVWGGNAQMKDPPDWEGYEQVLGVKNGQHASDFEVALTGSSTATNVLWPREAAHYTVQVTNLTDQLIKDSATIRIIRYGTKGKPDDVWTPVMYKIAELPSLTLAITLPAKGSYILNADPLIPETFGGYALVLDFGKHGRRLITSLVRTYAAKPERIQFPKQSLDDLGAAFLNRVGVQAIRMGVDYTPTTLGGYSGNGYYEKMKELENKLKEYDRKHITVLLMFGAGSNLMPLGMPRSFLDSQQIMLKTKQDFVWLPSLDEDFRKFVYRICKQYGWPKGPVTAVSLWNEPWEGISISGWQADMLRYREIYRKMAEGVLSARQEGAEVLVGGTDSHSNAWDKLFADGSMDFLPIFDFCSVHYEGMESAALYPEWINRKSPYGRVKIWDTESWVANTDDRIGLVVATNRSAGYDRSMGIYGGYLLTNAGKGFFHAWSPASALGAVQHLLGERSFNRLLFKNGLPFILVFDGENGNKEDGTIVVCGDIGNAFGKDNVLYRQIKRENARLFLRASEAFRLFDFYGNPVPPENGRLVIPLACQGYFLRTDGSKGAFDRLTTALEHARIEGYEPVEIIAKDMVHRINEKPTLDVQLTNILNRPVKSRLSISIGDLRVAEPSIVSLMPHETKTIPVRILSGRSAANNTYLITIKLDAGIDGMASHAEEMHVNLVSRLTIEVDGRLEDWKNALPQTVSSEGKGNISLTEAAWYPFKKFNTTAEGYANGYLAYDDHYFYFASKAADKTPHPGTYRFATRPDDEFFYPDTSYKMKEDTSFLNPYERKDTLIWPADVRHFSYRKDPVLPDNSGLGELFDNVLIAFNVLPAGQDGLLANPPGTMPRYTGYKCTDYEYALNKVSSLYGGGTEIWRLLSPGMNRKHFFPRQPKSPHEGAVTKGQLVIRREGNTLITECAIPWEEIPEVKKALDEHRTIKFSFRVNDNGAPGSCLELARDRSVSKRNARAFHPDWKEHWANEVEFGFEETHH